MSIRSYIAMVYGLVAVMVLGLAAPGSAVHAEKPNCTHEARAAAVTAHVNAHVSGASARLEIGQNWLGWLMWEPAVYHAPVIRQPEPTMLISCGAADPGNGAARLDLAVATQGDLHTLTLPVIDTARHPGEAVLLEPAPDDTDLPAYLSLRPGTPAEGQEPLWLTVETGGRAIEIWSDTHTIDVVAAHTRRIVTLAPDADLTDPVFVLRYRLGPDAPRLVARTTGGT